MSDYKTHWFLGFIIAIVILVITHYLFQINISEEMLILSVIATLIFSILSDIDHKNSYISAFLHITTIMAIIAIFTKSIPFNFYSVLVLVSIAGLELYHWKYAKDSWKHRQFPHTFTFGFITLIIFLIITKSMIGLIIGFFTFFSHLILDGHVEDAIEKDKKFWKNLLRRTI